METLKQLYIRGLNAVGETPSWKKDWRWLVLYSLLVYAAVLALRLSFAGRWDHPELWVNGERILATHDAYFWLAKAKGVGVLAGYPLAEFTSLLHTLTGWKLGTIAFWTPAFLGALVGVVCLLWGWLLAGRNAGIFAGLAGSLVPGFFYRSRLGYYDSDMFTLLMPMLVAWMLAYLLSSHTKRGWFCDLSESPVEAEKSPGYWFLLAFVFGLITRFACMWHYDILNVSIAYFFLAAAFLAVNGRSGLRIQGFYGLTIYLLAAFPGANFSNLGVLQFIRYSYYGIEIFYIVASALLVALLVAPRFGLALRKNKWICAGIFCFFVVLSDVAGVPATGVLAKLSGYWNPAGTGESVVRGAVQGPYFPSILQSVIEAKLVPLGEILERAAFAPWLGWFSLIASVLIVVFRPAALFLLPLVVLLLISVKLGVRFTMFGGSALMVFTGVSIYYAVAFAARKLPWRQPLLWTTQILFGLIVLGYCYSFYGELPLTPVIPRQHAEALVELGEKAPKDGMIWTWWDWGYASKYYAGMQTTIDGGKHSGADVYPTALALSTGSFRQANQMIRAASQHKVPRWNSGYNIAAQWAKLSGKEVVGEIEALGNTDLVFPVQEPQYFIVSWKDLTILKWITYFGNWNMETGITTDAKVGNYAPGQLGFNLQRGAVMNRQGGGGLVKEITVLDQGAAESQYYFMNAISPRLLPKMQFLLINKVTRQSVMMDHIGHRSMIVRLLTGDPNDPEITPYFKLVVDKLPFARVYEVVQ